MSDVGNRIVHFREILQDHHRHSITECSRKTKQESALISGFLVVDHFLSVAVFLLPNPFMKGNLRRPLHSAELLTPILLGVCTRVCGLLCRADFSSLLQALNTLETINCFPCLLLPSLQHLFLPEFWELYQAVAHT